MSGNSKRAWLIFLFLVSLPVIFLSLRIGVGGKDPIFFKHSAFDLVIKDERTGAPISGALVHLDWVKRVGGSFGGPGFASIKEMWVMSDKEGKVVVPEFKSTHIFSTFENLTAEINQPFFEKKRAGLIEMSLTEYMKQNPQKGVVKGSAETTVYLMYLKDKYINAKCIAEKVEGGYRLGCSSGGQGYAFDVSEAFQYFKEIETHRISNYDRVLVPNKAKCEKLWESIKDSVYSESKYKPGKDFQPYEILSR